MIQSEIMDFIGDLEKIIPIKKRVGIDLDENENACVTEENGNIEIMTKEDIQKLKMHRAEEYLLINRSGGEIISTFLEAIVHKDISPRFAVIVKRWSVLGEIIQAYHNSLDKYAIYYPEDDKSVCLLIRKEYSSEKFKTDIVSKYHLVYRKPPKIKKNKKRKSIKKTIRSLILGNRFFRELYSVWRENRKPIYFIKAIWRIFKERIQNNNLPVLDTNDAANLDMCIYDTDRECIVKPGRDIECNTVSVVVCVFNALEDVKELLISLWNNRSFPYEIILVDDGSDAPTKEYLEYYSDITGCQLVRHEQSWGYTRSANDGLRRAKSDYVVLLNSDTIVTSKWIEKMLEVFLKYPDTGIVGPLSNSATYQNIPHLHDFETGKWIKNTLPDGFNVELMNYTIEMNSKEDYPIVPALNGFCTMISRNVINEIGFLDEEHFPIGYGEEVDYCLRTRCAGFQLRVADNTYIFHEKSKSFGDTKKKTLSKQATPYLTEVYGEMYTSIGKELESNEVLMRIRNCYNTNVSKTIRSVGKILGKKIGFVLLTRGGNGGANSVCQEVIGMRKLGADAYVINTSNYREAFSENYPELKKYTYYYKKGSTEDLYEKTKDFDILIATIFTSVAVISDVMKLNPRIKPAYYIQDYETLFFEKEDIMYREAFNSYTLIPENCLFAKTNWLVNTVSLNHHISVKKVVPSIDNRIYNPYLIKSKSNGGKFKVAAMVRPRTPRRNPEGTLNVLKMLKNQFGDKLDIVIFGCSESELEPFGELCRFEYQNLGVLKKGEVAGLLAESDIFIDMSYYQAFGRTGLEGMCYGCVPVLPKEGGTDEYAIHNVNAIVVDTNNDKAVLEDVSRIISEPGKIQSMQHEAISTARKYCVLTASWSELEVLNEIGK